MNNLNENTFTLHIRVTKKCNADCSYCSSYEKNPTRMLNLDELRIAINNIRDRIIQKNLGGKRNNISVQYIGGEILTTNSEYMENFVKIVRESLSPIFKNFQDGAQTNLIGSTKKINKIVDLFSGNIGTSYDDYTNQRTINGDNKRYKTIFLKNITGIKRRLGSTVGGIVVLDSEMKHHIYDQINLNTSKNIPTTIRTVFHGGSEVSGISIKETDHIFKTIFLNWILKSKVSIEPFYTMTRKRLVHKFGGDLSCISGCPSQANCVNVSMNLDPNGDIFVCQDLSDSKEYKIGNALLNTWDDELINKLGGRPDNLSLECLECKFLNDCQGGCMKESIENGSGIYGKPEMCYVWKNLYFEIDRQLENNGDKIKEWINSL